ncbi:hypothetical protein D9M73_165370 [compost metagenome]
MPTRPIIPPKAVPAIYKPMVLPRCSGAISSAIQAIVTAGTPPCNRPSSARAMSKLCQLGVNIATILRIAAHSIELKITPRRPIACEKALDSTIEIAKKAVVKDKAKELLAGLIWKLWLNAGRSGCTQ